MLERREQGAPTVKLAGTSSSQMNE